MKVDRPWGSFEKLTENQTTTIKIITIHAGSRTSLQQHMYRSEKWYVLEGNGYAILQNKQEIKPGDIIFVPKKTAHRLEAVTDLKILEISFGFFLEEDIQRLDDDYAR